MAFAFWSSVHVSGYILRTMLVSVHAAPNGRTPDVYVLDEDGHRSSLLGDEGQGKWRPDDACLCIFLLEDKFDSKLLS